MLVQSSELVHLLRLNVVSRIGKKYNIAKHCKALQKMAENRKYRNNTCFGKRVIITVNNLNK